MKHHRLALGRRQPERVAQLLHLAVAPEEGRVGAADGGDVLLSSQTTQDAGARRPPGRVVQEQVATERIEAVGHRGERARQRRLDTLLVAQQLLRRAHEGQAPRERLKEHDAEAVPVARKADAVSAACSGDMYSIVPTARLPDAVSCSRPRSRARPKWARRRAPRA